MTAGLVYKTGHDDTTQETLMHETLIVQTLYCLNPNA